MLKIFVEVQHLPPWITLLSANVLCVNIGFREWFFEETFGVEIFRYVRFVGASVWVGPSVRKVK